MEPARPGLGIADMLRDQMIRDGLSPQEATQPVLPDCPGRGCWSTTMPGLLDFQLPYARSRDEVVAVGRRIAARSALRR